VHRRDHDTARQNRVQFLLAQSGPVTCKFSVGDVSNTLCIFPQRETPIMIAGVWAAPRRNTYANILELVILVVHSYLH